LSEALFDKYLIASYSYYHLDYSPYSDTEYDMLCNTLARTWHQWEHPYKSLTDEDALRCGTGYHIKKEDYPEYIREAAAGV
jgi:NAD-dependent DNA ligase